MYTNLPPTAFGMMSNAAFGMSSAAFDMQNIIAAVSCCTREMTLLHATLRRNPSVLWTLGEQTRFCARAKILDGALNGYRASISFAPDRSGNRVEDHGGSYNYRPELCEILLFDPDGETYYNDNIGYFDVLSLEADDDGTIAEKIMDELVRLARLTSTDLGNAVDLSVAEYA